MGLYVACYRSNLVYHHGVHGLYLHDAHDGYHHDVYGGYRVDYGYRHAVCGYPPDVYGYPHVVCDERHHVVCEVDRLLAPDECRPGGSPSCSY